MTAGSTPAVWRVAFASLGEPPRHRVIECATAALPKTPATAAAGSSPTGAGCDAGESCYGRLIEQVATRLARAKWRDGDFGGASKRRGSSVRRGRIQSAERAEPTLVL
jgi:hypothetical protein